MKLLPSFHRTKEKAALRTKQSCPGLDSGLAMYHMCMRRSVCVYVFTVPRLVYSSNICYCDEPVCGGDIFQPHPCHNPAAFSIHKFQG